MLINISCNIISFYRLVIYQKKLENLKCSNNHMYFLFQLFHDIQSGKVKFVWITLQHPCKTILLPIEMHCSMVFLICTWKWGRLITYARQECTETFKNTSAWQLMQKRKSDEKISLLKILKNILITKSTLTKRAAAQISLQN